MRSLSAVVALMFVIAAVCIAPLTENIQNDYVKRLYMWKSEYINEITHTTISYEQYSVCYDGRIVEGIHPFVRIARMGCQDNDGNTFLQFSDLKS